MVFELTPGGSVVDPEHAGGIMSRLRPGMVLEMLETVAGDVWVT